MYSAGQIAHSINTTLEGNPEAAITHMATLENAGNGALTFISDKKYADALPNTKASAVIVHPKMADRLPEGCTGLIADNPHLAMAYATALFVPQPKGEGADLQYGHDCQIASHVYTGKNVVLGHRVVLMPGVFLGDDVVIGDDVTLYPNVVLYPKTRIGRRTVIHAGTVIGSDGFGYAHTKEGKHIKIHHLGNVEIGNDVEIGANTTIDRAVFTKTVIGDGTKIDNLVQIAHNVTTKENVIIAGQTGIAGSVTIGKNVIIAAQSGSVDHVTIADGTIIAARGGVTKNTEPGKTYSGFPLMEHKSWLKLQAILSRMVRK